MQTWISELENLQNPDKAKILSRFFKTGEGEYGEGDKFLGITVPQNREVAKLHFHEPLCTIREMMQNPYHEIRLSALLALVIKYKKEKTNPKEIFDFYLTIADRCNNWDLVDLSAPYIIGEYMLTYPQPAVLDQLSDSDNLWLQRIAIISTLTLVRHGLFSDTLRIAEKYLTHSHPLIHKATGWLLREVGKKDIQTLRTFLNSHAHTMPRTALRYAIEKLPDTERKYYLNYKP